MVEYEVIFLPAGTGILEADFNLQTFWICQEYAFLCYVEPQRSRDCKSPHVKDKILEEWAKTGFDRPSFQIVLYKPP